MSSPIVSQLALIANAMVSSVEFSSDSSWRGASLESGSWESGAGSFGAAEAGASQNKYARLEAGNAELMAFCAMAPAVGQTIAAAAFESLDAPTEALFTIAAAHSTVEAAVTVAGALGAVAVAAEGDAALEALELARAACETAERREEEARAAAAEEDVAEETAPAELEDGEILEPQPALAAGSPVGGLLARGNPWAAPATSPEGFGALPPARPCGAVSPQAAHPVYPPPPHGVSPPVTFPQQFAQGPSWAPMSHQQHPFSPRRISDLPEDLVAARRGQVPVPAWMNPGVGPSSTAMRDVEMEEMPDEMDWERGEALDYYSV